MALEGIIFQNMTDPPNSIGDFYRLGGKIDIFKLFSIQS